MQQLCTATIFSLNKSCDCNLYFISLCRLLKGRSFPGKVLLTRRSDPLDSSSVQERSPDDERSFSDNDTGPSDRIDKSVEVVFVNCNKFFLLPMLIVLIINKF